MENQYNKNNIGLFFLGLTLALGMIFGSYFISSALLKIKLNNGTITVKGCAEKKITSDFVKWDCVLNIPQNNLKDAYAKLESDRERLVAYLQNAGIRKEDIHFTPVSMSTIYKLNEQGLQTNTVEGYILSQDFSMGSQEVTKISKIASEITELLQEDVHVISFRPQYYYLNLDALKISMLGEAAKDAKNRAEKLANNSGSKVGILRSAQQGVFQITPAYSNSCSDYGECDTTSIDKTIKAIVTMEYNIE